MAIDDLQHGPFHSRERSQALVDGLQAKIRQFLQARLESLFTSIDERLFDIANSASSQRDQTHFFDTMRMLRKHRDELGEGIFFAVSEAFGWIDRTLPVAGGGQESDELSLELVKNDVLEEMITLDNMVSRVIARSQPELDLLTRRLSYVVGHNLPEHANPFVPDYLCEGFARKTALLKLDFEPRLVILKLFDRILFKDWPVLVRESNQLLREATILADLEKHRPAIKKITTQAAAPAQINAEAATAPATNAPLVRAVRGHTGRRGSVRGGAGSDPVRGSNRHTTSNADSRQGEAGEGTVTNPRSATERYHDGQRFTDHEHLYGDVLTGLHRLIHQQARSEREARGEFPDKQWPRSLYLSADELAGIVSSWRAQVEDAKLLGALSEEGLERAIAEVLASNNHSIDSLKEMDQSIVRLLDKTFGQLNRQRLNPPSLNHLVLKLELPATWLALKDPMFLERPNHPGRRLINELCKAATTLQGEEAGPADPLRGKIDEILERLNAFAVSMQELAGLLTEFIDFVEKDKRAQSLREQRVLEEEEAQAKLADANGKVVRILSDRLMNRRWPGFLLNFCEKAWSRVLFLNCLRHGHLSPEWRAALGLLDHLLVLVSARRNPEGDELAGLLTSIEENLNDVGYDRGECRHHLECLREYFEGISVGKGELDDAGANSLSVDSLSVDLPGGNPEQDVPAEDLDMAMLDAVDTLKKGTWVEFRDESSNTSLRCKLAGTVNAASKLVFTNRKGAKVAQEYRHRMALKMQQGKVIVLDNSHLFDQAYDQVIAEIQAEIRERSVGA